MLGARIEGDGTRFRVWGKNSEKAFVVYDEHWTKETAFEMSREDEYWQAFIPGVKAGTRYKFIFVKDGRDYWRIDPAARDTRHSGIDDPLNGGFVVDLSVPRPEWQTPAFSDLILYQLHIGSFAGRNDDFVGQIQSDTASITQVQAKLGYIRELGFNAVQLMPLQEYQSDRSWGYNPSFYYSVESAYGTPEDLRNFVAIAHEQGLAVIFDVVYNHVSSSDNSLWNWEVFSSTAHGDYLYPPKETPWGPAPAFEKDGVREFFVENARMLFKEYHIDGIRFDSTRALEENRGSDNNGWRFIQELTWRLKGEFPDKYLIAEHVADHDSIVRDAGMHATWYSTAQDTFKRAAQGEAPLENLEKFLKKDFGWGHNYPNQWNLVKYLLGSHDDCADDQNGHKNNSDRYRYFVELFGGRDNWYARAKNRLGWALNATIMGTPMMFMGSECCHWGYWHDSFDANGDHRFDWNLAGDTHGMEMRRLVASANWVRWNNPALRNEFLDIVHRDSSNNVLAFKRYVPGQSNCVLVVVNVGDNNFGDFSYGVTTDGQNGQWIQVLCTQDAAFGGWDGSGNAYHEPWTQNDGKIYINLPKWSVLVFRLL